jgi:O-antigen/teichoic acid export membrane protein
MNATRPIDVKKSAARGMAIMVGSSLLMKVMSFIQLTVLAFVLSPSEYAPVAMTYTVVSFAMLLMRTGLEEILVQRFTKFHLWASHAFWMSLTVGIMGMVVIWACAPVGRWFFNDSDVFYLILLCSLNAPLTTLGTVPNAYLNIKLQFGVLSMLALLQSLVTTAATCILAFQDFKSTSPVLGAVLGQFVLTISLWAAARVKVSVLPSIKYWKYFLVDSVYIQSTRLMYTISANVDMLVVGKLSPQEFGVYSYAFNQSLQATRLIASNAASVLLPSLRKIGDDNGERMRLFERGIVTLVPILIPLSIMQATLGDPIYRLLFRSQWWDGIPYFQVLSLSMAGGGIYMLYSSLFAACRRNDLLFWNGLQSTVAYIVFIPIGWLIGGVMGVAFSVGLAIISSVIGSHLMSKRIGWTSPSVVLFLGKAVMIAIICNVPCYFIDQWLFPSSANGGWKLQSLRLNIMAAFFLPCFLGALAIIAPDSWNAVRHRMPFLRRPRFAGT